MGETILDPKKEKRVRIGMWILIAGGIMIFLLAIFQYPKYLAAPFAGYGRGGGSWKSVAEQDAEKLQELKTKDTDGDGLTDYDEMYVYGTSVYLADSDSDGFNDKQEIESGNDPNCPAGQTCSAARGAAATSLLSGASGVAGGLGGILSGQATAEEVRDALRRAGMSDADLSKLDDATLIELYTQTLQENGTIPAGTNANTNSSAGAAAPGTTPTAAQLREILKNNGVDEAALRSVDDATLLKIYEESLKY